MNNKKKICIVRDGLSRDNGGAITAILSLAENIRFDYDLSFVFLYEDTIDKAALKNYEYECIMPSFNMSRIERKVRLYSTTLCHLNRILKKKKPDCVISFGSTSLTLVTILKKFRGYKTIYSERSDPNYCARTLSDRIRYLCYNFADKMVFQIPGVRDYFNQRIRDKSVIISNPVGIPEKQWALVNNKEIVCVARMELRQKRQDILLGAFRKVLVAFPDSVLHLYGDGADMDEVKEIAVKYDISNKVIFHGNIKDVKEKLRDYRVFVLTSDYEGMPNSLLEAMALGMPVVSTDCSPGGAAYLINNEKNGFLVSRGNVDEIAQALIKVLNDDKRSVFIGNEARNRAKLQSYERNKNEWLNVIEETLNT